MALLYTLLSSQQTLLTFKKNLPSVFLKCAFFLGLGSGFVFGKNIPFDEDFSNFKNPERGFFWVDTSTSSHTVVRNYIFVDPTAPEKGVAQLKRSLDMVRKSKKKLIPRIHFGALMNGKSSEMTPILDHFKQIYQENYDVIAVVEAGMVGPWGEWRSTAGIPENDYISKKEVLFKLLEVVPKERFVAMRYNADKRGIYGTNLPITAAEAFNQSNRSRTSAHSDCFLADTNSAGTYQYLGDRGGTGLGIEPEKNFLNADNLYVPQHGETCEVAPPDGPRGSYATCPRALTDLKRMRWDILNEYFFETAIENFKKGGCYDSIAKHLGYRIVLTDVSIDDIVDDGILNATVNLKNVGWGKIYNARKVEIVLRHKTTNVDYILPTNVDPRFWSPGTSQSISLKIPVPKNVPLADYSVYISLQDPAPKLYGIPEYAIRFANLNVWEPVKGYNSLQHTLKVSSTTDITPVEQLPILEKSLKIKQLQSLSSEIEIEFNLPTAGNTQIEVYTVSSSKRVTVLSSPLGSGEHRFQFNLESLDRKKTVRGIYYVTLSAPSVRVTHPLVLY